MKNDPRKPSDDMQLEQELAGLRAEWDRAARAEPPDLLDQAVLNAARRDLEKGRRRFPMRWLGGFATAAVVVVALTLVVEQDPSRTGTAPVPESMPLEKGVPEPMAEPPEESPLVQAPLPPAEPKAVAREARRDAVRLKASGDDAIAGKAETEAVQGFDSPAAAAPAAADMPEAEAFADEALEEAVPRDPERWIEELLQLRAKGDTDALEAGLAAFRSTYPDYPLPDELSGDAP